MKSFAFAFFFILETANAEVKCMKHGEPLGICTKLSNCPSAIDGISRNIYPCQCSSYTGKYDEICCGVANILKIPEKCKLQNNEEGICTEVSKCPNAPDDLKSNKSLNTCRYEGNTRIVCCEVTKQSKSKKMCKRWHDILKIDKHASSCKWYMKDGGKVETLLQGDSVGGLRALYSEFPHMVALGYGSEQTRSWSCGGSLISEKFILTAAHCLYSIDLGQPNTVRLGVLNVNYPFFGDHKIKRAIRYPDYRPPSIYNDIALLELTDEVIFTDVVKPACLQVDEQYTSENWTATGWGSLGYYEAQSDVLQKIYIKEFTSEECNRFYPETTRALSKGVIDTQICAGEDGIDTCKGDSGGPLQVKNEFGLYNIIGITSFGKPCGVTKAPGVYTRVSKYVDWIESIVWP